jgi:nucleotide-binding universal stress UspA family protein
MGDVVVGVDGSEHSKRAAAFAAEEAVLRGAALRIVSAYQSPAVWMGMGEALGATVSATLSPQDLERSAMETIDAVVDSLPPAPGLRVIKETVQGHAGPSLVNASLGAVLLVVGSRGHGEVESALLGSVGMHCVHHARCPVAVVPK